MPTAERAHLLFLWGKIVCGITTIDWARLKEYDGIEEYTEIKEYDGIEEYTEIKYDGI